MMHASITVRIPLAIRWRGGRKVVVVPAGRPRRRWGRWTRWPSGETLRWPDSGQRARV